MAKKIEGHVSLQHADDGFTGDLWMVDSTVTTNAHPRGTLVIHEGKPERVFTESEVDELIKAGNAMSVAMYQYEMDVDDDPPQKHRDMMNAWEAAVRRLRDPA
jgi:hypothetical protein